MSLRLNDLRIISSWFNTADAGQARTVSKLQETELRHELEGLAIDVMGKFEYI